MFPYVEPTVETADEIDKKQEIIDTDFINLKSKFDKVNDVISEQKKEKEIEDTIENIFDTNNFDDFWWKEDLFDKTDSTATVDASKKILEDIRPVDNRTIQEIIDDQFIPIDDTTQQELEDDDYLSFESENEIDATSAWDNNKTTVSKPGPIYKLSTDYNKKVKAAEKKQKKYLRKKIGSREKSNKISAEWLKTAGYLDTKDQDKIKLYFHTT